MKSQMLMNALKRSLILIASSLVMGSTAFAGLTIHAAEFGVGKFHRYDNKVHAYDAMSAWAPFVFPANAPTDKVQVIKNQDGSYTVFYATLDELISSVVQISQTENQKVSVLNVHGHGLPGAMWFPKDAKTLASSECSDWKTAAYGDDEANYKQYYSPVSSMEVVQIRWISNMDSYHMGCTTGLSEWQSGVAKNAAFLTALDPAAQVHFLSCVVGLGSRGDKFTTGIGALFFPQGSTGRVVASTNFGLGDWSMPEGMGFWDMITSAQLNHDNSMYETNKRDRDIMQKGTVRIARFATGWKSTLLGNQDFMSLGFEQNVQGTEVPEFRDVVSLPAIPTRIRIPGTSFSTSIR